MKGGHCYRCHAPWPIVGELCADCWQKEQEATRRYWWLAWLGN